MLGKVLTSTIRSRKTKEVQSLQNSKKTIVIIKSAFRFTKNKELLDISVYISLKQKNLTFWNVGLRCGNFFFILGLHTTHFSVLKVITMITRAMCRPCYGLVLRTVMTVFNIQSSSPIPIKWSLSNFIPVLMSNTKNHGCQRSSLRLWFRVDSCECKYEIVGSTACLKNGASGNALF